MAEDKTGSTGAGAQLLTGCQVRGARGMTKMSVQELARASGVSESTIKRVESAYGILKVQVDSVVRLYAYFVGRGMTFIPEDGSPEGPGVRWGRYPGRGQ